MITARLGRIVLLIVLPLTLLVSFLLLAHHNGSISRFSSSYSSSSQTSSHSKPKPNLNGTRENAAFVVLVRNSELNGLRETLQNAEDRFNRKYNYPWVFLNDEPFTDQFKEWTAGLVSGETFYGILDQQSWGYPDWVDQEKARLAREDMANRNIIYGGSESYRHMCRFQSGFFFRHPLLAKYDYYWRVEPNVKFYCDVDYDPFQVMRERDLKYGWTLSIKEYAETIPTLWSTVKSFMAEHPEHIVPKGSPESLMDWITDDGGETYNLCHFWSNFEIGSIKWLNSKAYMDYFEALDKSGGFFYERWGDAPVHSIAAALMLKKSEVHWFYDIGYFHNPYSQCPREPAWLAAEKCSCDPQESFDTHWYSCTPQFLKVTGKKPTDFLITER
ncbi:glycosyltransferase family 15 protein [Phycomyces blakesleeanus]